MMTDRITRETKRYALTRRRQKRAAVKMWKRKERQNRNERWGFSPQERRMIECFWTWPFGHVYEKTPAKSIKICMVCGKKHVTGNWGGGY